MALINKMAYKITLLIIGAVLCSSCTMSKSWMSENRGAQFISVTSQNGEDVEPALKLSGKNYYCSYTTSSAGGLDKACYVRYYPSDKMTDTKVKLFETPRALLVDAGEAALVAIYVVGSIAVGHVPRGESVKLLW